MPVKWTPGERVLRRRTLDPHQAGSCRGRSTVPTRTAAQYPHREATPGIRVLHRASGFTGELVALDGDEVVLRGHTGLEKRYRNLPGHVRGRRHADPSRARCRAAVEPTTAPRVADGRRTASGSRAVVGAKARVARGQPHLGGGRARRRAGREGVGRRPAHRGHRGRAPRRRRPPGRRGARRSARARASGSACCSTTWSPGSKEARLAAAVRHPHVLVTGTPYVDVWQAVRPAAVGIDAWPVIPKGQDWKTGICRGARRRRPARDVAAHPRLGARLEAARAAVRRRGRAAHRLRHRDLAA